MITDRHLTLARPEDGAVSVTRAVCLTQSDLPAPTDGAGPYEGLWLSVLAYDAVSGLEVTLEHSDFQTGPFDTLVKFPAVTTGMGERIVVAPVPHSTRNWVRLGFSSAARVNALLTAGVDKREGL